MQRRSRLELFALSAASEYLHQQSLAAKQKPSKRLEPIAHCVLVERYDERQH
ncbi:hypothetical protein IFO70_02705 [Phormidium tenue FACHB-886]|nr:hypothetical protein [Phormidium tenue FACHB-886]